MFWAPFRLNFLLIVFLVASFRLAVVAQSRVQDEKSTNSGQAASATGQEQDPLKRPLSKKQQKAGRDAISGKEHSLRKWPDEDVSVIITKEERDAFNLLSNEEERERYTEIFWQNRDPTPDTIENEYRDEYYRRVAYANERFSSGVPGSKTDRGRIYILHGPPDEIESHPSGGTYERPLQQGGGTTTTFPFETWRYRYLEGVGDDVVLEFVDSCMCGDYHMTIDPNEKDALLHTPGAGLTQYEQMGLTSKADRIAGIGNSTLGPNSGMDTTKQFDKLEQWALLNQAPKVKFKDLEEVVNHKINVNLMPFDIRTDFVRVTGDTVLVPVTIQVKNKDITFINKDGIQRGTVNIFGRVTGMTGKIAQTFEDTVQVDVPNDLLEKTQLHSSLYWKALPLRPGRYRFDVVVKDINGDRVGTWSHGVQVPDFNEDKLAYSSLILSDHMEKVPAKNIGSGNFVIGQTKFAYPHLEPADGTPASFKRDQRMNLWLQVYNLQTDEKTKRPSAKIEYEIVNVANNKPVLHSSESTDTMGNLGDQMTLEKSLALTSFQPGIYRLTVKVDDNVSKQQITPSVRFAVE